MSDINSAEKLIAFLKSHGFKETVLTPEQEEEFEEYKKWAKEASREDLEAEFAGAMFNWNSTLDQRDELQERLDIVGGILYGKQVD